MMMMMMMMVIWLCCFTKYHFVKRPKQATGPCQAREIYCL